jgi:hypothetical protein
MLIAHLLPGSPRLQIGAGGAAAAPPHRAGPPSASTGRRSSQTPLRLVPVPLGLHCAGRQLPPAAVCWRRRLPLRAAASARPPLAARPCHRPTCAIGRDSFSTTSHASNLHSVAKNHCQQNMNIMNRTPRLTGRCLPAGCQLVLGGRSARRRAAVPRHPRPALHVEAPGRHEAAAAADLARRHGRL